jgi:hypothetical protein
VQREYTRQLAYRFRFAYDTYEDRLQYFNMLKLELRREYYDMCQLHRIIHDTG